MISFEKLAEEISSSAELLAQKARYQHWLATGMKMLGVLAEELRKLGVEPPELLAASGLLVWRCDAVNIYVWATQSFGGSYEVRLRPLSAWLLTPPFCSESAAKTALWIADRLEELKAESLKEHPPEPVKQKS